MPSVIGNWNIPMSHGEPCTSLNLQPDGAASASFDMKTDFFDALSRNDIERAAAVFSVDGVLLFPGLRPVTGRPLVKRMLGLIRRRYSRISWEMGSIINTDRWLVSPWSVSGEFQTTGASYVNEGLSLIRLDRDGRIAMLSDYFKDTVAFSAAAPMAGAVGKGIAALAA